MAALTCLCLTVHTAIKIVSVLVSTLCPFSCQFYSAGSETHGFGMLGKCFVTEPWAQPSLPHSVSTPKAGSCFQCSRAMVSFGGASREG